MEARRRLFVGRNDAELIPPVGYKWIEYATSTDANSSHFVTLPYGFDPTDELELMGAILNTSAERWLLGARTWNNNTNRLGFLGTSINKFTFAFGAQGTPNNLLQPPVATDKNVHIASYKNRKFSFDDSVADVSTIGFGGTTTELRLFYGYNTCPGHIYYFKQVKQSGEKLYIRPIQSETSGEVEMYDVISKTMMPRTMTLYPPT